MDLSVARSVCFGVALCLWGGVHAGCAKWTALSKTDLILPSPTMSPDSVTVEIATLGLPVADGRAVNYWEEVDEQILPLETRQQLAHFGIRLGIISGQLPKELRQKIDKASASQKNVGDEESLVGDSQRVSQKRVQNRAGHRSKIVIGESREQMIVLLPADNGLRGETYQQAQCLFSLKCFPQGDGRVKLELTPEIEHGAVRQRVIGQAQDGSFRLDAGKDRAVFDQIRVAPLLTAGQTLVVSSTPETKGLGRQFFSETSSGSREERVLLIRLAQTQVDDLFLPDNTSEPLTTPLD